MSSAPQNRVLRFSSIVIIAAAPLLAALPRPAAAAPADWFAGPRPRLDFSAGTMQLFDDDKEFAWGLAYRPAWRFCHIAPNIEFGAGHNEEIYAALGIAAEIQLPARFVLVPTFSVGYYNARKGLDLGLDMQFATQVSLEYEFGAGHRLGLTLGHLSNGSFSDYNPGTEALMLTYSLPLDVFWK